MKSNKKVVLIAALMTQMALTACSGSSGESDLVSEADSSTDNSGSNAAGQICVPSARLQATESRPYLGNLYRPETALDERFHQLCNQVTPENASKWNSIEQVRGVMDWTVLDEAKAFADSFNYDFKFHTLIAANNEPPWFSTLSDAERLEEVVAWMDGVAARYPNIQQIDVISEPLAMSSDFIDALGGTGDTGWDWAIRAFELAKERFPESELLLNDYKIGHDDDENARYLQLAVLLQQRSLLDGVGVEGHFLEDVSASKVGARLDQLTSLDVPVYLSDFDINLSDDQQQLEKMKELFPAFYDHPDVEGLTLWGYRENQIWRSDAYLVSKSEIDRPALDWLECYVGLNAT